MKKLLALIFALTLVVALVACNVNEEVTTEETTTAVEETTTAGRGSQKY